MAPFARQAVATGLDAAKVAAKIVEELAPTGDEELRLALVFADWRLDPEVIAQATYRGLRAPVVGGTTLGVIGRGVPIEGMSAVGIGFYGDWLRVGLGVAPELPKAALARSRDAVHHAATMLGTTVNALDSSRHIGLSFVPGTCGFEEAYCIGSAAAAPRIRFVGGCTSTDREAGELAAVWVNGEVLTDAGVAILLASELPFHALASSHLVPTGARTVVTAVSGRRIEELDGYPAVPRLQALVRGLGVPFDEGFLAHTFARYIDGVPYLRSIVKVEGTGLALASNVEPGHVLRVMQPGNLIAQTADDLAAATERVGGSVTAMLAFSCVLRHAEAKSRSLERELAGAYSLYPTVGLQTFGEQTGMLLVNHTLSGLAFGEPRSDR